MLLNSGIRLGGPHRRPNKLVPLAGIEPALLAELDFESSASTSSATGAFAPPGPKKRPGPAKRADYSGRRSAVNPRHNVIAPDLDSFPLRRYDGCQHTCRDTCRDHAPRRRM